MPVISPLRTGPSASATPHSLSCDTCAVRDRSICARLNHDELVKLNAISQFKNFDPGQTILRTGEDQHFFATVVSGAIKLTKSLSDGRQQIVGLQFPGDFLGRPWRRTSPYDATAANSVVLCMFSRAKFEHLSQSHPVLGHTLLAHTLDGLDAAQDWLLLLGRKTATEKVATLLTLMHQRLTPTTPSSPIAEFDLPLTRAEMADCLGLTLETVVRKMTALKSAGIIATRASGRTITIRNPTALQHAADQDAAP